MGTIDSDRNFETQGKIISLSRGRPWESYKESLVTLVIESTKGEHEVDIPIGTKSDFEVIPFQLILVGVDVKYSKTYHVQQKGTTEYWNLEVLSGPLKGNTYNHEKYKPSPVLI